MKRVGSSLNKHCSKNHPGKQPIYKHAWQLTSVEQRPICSYVYIGGGDTDTGSSIIKWALINLLHCDVPSTRCTATIKSYFHQKSSNKSNPWLQRGYLLVSVVSTSSLKSLYRYIKAQDCFAVKRSDSLFSFATLTSPLPRTPHVQPGLECDVSALILPQA